VDNLRRKRRCAQRVRDSVEYIVKGGGVSQIRDETQSIVYSSDTDENVVSVPVEPDPPIQEAEQAAIRDLIRILFGGTS